MYVLYLYAISHKMPKALKNRDSKVLIGSLEKNIQKATRIL